MLKTEKGIFCTAIPESIAVKVAPAITLVNMISITQVPMLAGRKLFIATEVAYAARTRRKVIFTRGYAARRIATHAAAARVVCAVCRRTPTTTAQAGTSL